MRKIFYILFVSHNESQASIYADKVKEGFPQIPINIDFATDGSKGIEKYEKFYQRHKQKGDFLHRIIISDIKMPVMDGISLVKEIRKLEGSTVIFLLGEKDPDINDSAVDYIETPIVNWTDFLGKIENLIPEEFKITYGMPRRNNLINKKLNEFSKKFLEENKIKNVPKGTEGLSLLPKYFEEEEKEGMPVDVQDMSDDKDTIIRFLNKKVHKLERGQVSNDFGFSKKRLYFQYFLEIFLLGSLLIYTIVLFNQKADVKGIQEAPFLHFKYVMAIMTALTFISYFFSKVFEKYFIKKERKKFN
jgi:CheY-like chemotaxis protein